ncbi:hypothetical protein ACQP2Y_40380 [Actinoplanes sp. CA-051413]|uniref:hypothetical protein n=1 Tax=Actinoplanes sp. CA-051413 TaxID=3239899 RepID=UPI003D95F96A
MGYTGRIVIVRSAEPLTALAGADVLNESSYAGGWRAAQLDGDLRDALRMLVAETGAPAITAFILDSDVADVEAATPAGGYWHVYLHPEKAADYGAPELGQTAAEVTELALAWAAEAGLTADGEAVRTALDAANVFAEETFYELLAALGIKPAQSE